MSSSDQLQDDSPPPVDTTPVEVLDKVAKEGRVWADLSAQYGVTNPDPPWKVNVDGLCDALAAGNCALPPLERRWEEDELSETLYADIPFPERQLLALAHSMIKRGLIDEKDLARRMEEVEKRLNS